MYAAAALRPHRGGHGAEKTARLTPGDWSLSRWSDAENRLCLSDVGLGVRRRDDNSVTFFLFLLNLRTTERIHLKAVRNESA